MIVFFLKRPTDSLLRKETFANFTNPIKPAKQPIMIYAIIILSVSLVAAILYLLTVSRRQSAIEAELAVRNATTAQLKPKCRGCNNRLKPTTDGMKRNDGTRLKNNRK